MIQGRVVGFEINSQEPEKAAAFYQQVFGWKTGEANDDYWPVLNQQIEGGIAKGPADFPHGTRIHIEVDEIDAAIKESLDNGAQLVRDKMEFDQFFLAYAVDPSGVGFALIQKK